ncbi:MAG: fumarylacetoacetate hydrolase family protein [Ferrimicrobium sp.]
MRLATLRVGSETRAAIDFDSHYRMTPFGDLAQALRFYGGDVSAIGDQVVGDPIPKEAAELAAAVTTPSAIICLGLNFADHVAEMKHDRENYPTLFAKFPATLTGPNDDITLPTISEKPDWEVELGVVIGMPARNVSKQDALNHVAGYVVVNDLSMRDYQRRTSQFLQGKIFERTTPVGPTLVTRDEVDDALDLRLTCAIDGEVMQDGRTTQMLFGVKETIAYISQILTLAPGDLIAMGTPSGVGAGRKPPVFLKPGQLLTTSIEGIGELNNRMV